jgi:two-component system, LytTR family, response regulator
VSPGRSSTRIRALVVDDEPLARRNVTVLLRRDEDIAEIGECDSGFAAIAEIRRAKPDLVFLDVQMPECDGFDVLEMLGTELPPATIFVTAHDEYAIRAFDAGALDYLLKPFDEKRFQLAVRRAKDQIVYSATARLSGPECFILRSAGRVVFVKVAEIEWIEAADYYAELHLAHEKHLLRRPLSELERELASSGFCRIHRSIIVNLDRVRGLELRVDGEYDAILRSGARLRVSRRFRKAMQERLKAVLVRAGTHE